MKVGYLVFNVDGNQDYLGAVDTSFLTSKEIKKSTSDNLGNLMFKFAARKLFNNDVFYVSYKDDPELVKDKFDVLVLPEANLINKSINYAVPASFVAKLNKPVLIFGVGAQAPLSSKVEFLSDLPKGTIDFLHEVSKRTPNIFCRGEYTKSVLEKIGISNVVAIGCPTFMINPSNNLWQKIAKNNQARILDRLSVTEGVYQMSKRDDMINYVERFLFKEVMDKNADYVGQEQSTVIKCGFGHFYDVDENDLKNLGKYVSPDSIYDNIKKVSLSRFKAFYRVDTWLNYACNRTAFSGTRIHGNMVGIQAGKPSLPVVHDSRTMELCETMRLPSLTTEEFTAIRTADDFISAYDIIYDKKHVELDAFRGDVALKYKMALEEVGLEPSENLLKILNS